MSYAGDLFAALEPEDLDGAIEVVRAFMSDTGTRMRAEILAVLAQMQSDPHAFWERIGALEDTGPEAVVKAFNSNHDKGGKFAELRAQKGDEHATDKEDEEDGQG